MKIYCPLCFWEPAANDTWTCQPSCGYVWNTFSTRGQCPQCFKLWQDTQCLACHIWSKHEEWYHDELPVKEEEDELVREATY